MVESVYSDPGTANSAMTNPNDAIRDAILRHLYAVHRAARGPKAVSVGIRDLQKAMRERGIKQQQVNSNLDYLIQKGWAVQVIEERSFTTRRGTMQSSEKISYKISDIGIDRLESASSYRREDSLSRIDVTNIAGVTVIGSGNIVNTDLADLARVLSEIESSLATAEPLSDEDRLSALADLATIQSQLAKPQPNRRVISQVWSAVEGVVTAAGLAELAAKAAALIAGLS